MEIHPKYPLLKKNELNFTFHSKDIFQLLKIFSIAFPFANSSINLSR